MRVRCNNEYKTGADWGNISGQPMLFECMDICILSPAHESEMRGYLVYVLIVKCVSLILFKFSHRILDWTALSWNLGDFFCLTFLGGSVDIHRDDVVNRRSFIYRSLACSRERTGSNQRVFHSHFSDLEPIHSMLSHSWQ